MIENLPKTYDPKDFEKRIYKLWNEKEYFRAGVNKEKKAFHNYDASPKCYWKPSYGACLK